MRAIFQEWKKHGRVPLAVVSALAGADDGTTKPAQDLVVLVTETILQMVTRSSKTLL